MSRAKNIVAGALALAAFGYIARLAILVAADWARSDRIRAMSNEGPLSKELPSILAQSIMDQGATVREFSDFAWHVPAEFARYLKIESM